MGEIVNGNNNSRYVLRNIRGSYDVPVAERKR